MLDKYFHVLRQKRDTLLAVYDTVASLLESSPLIRELSRSNVLEQGTLDQEFARTLKELKSSGKALHREVLSLALFGESSPLLVSLEGALVGTKMFTNWTIDAPVVLSYGGNAGVTIYSIDPTFPRHTTWKAFLDEIHQGDQRLAALGYVRIEREFPLLASGGQLVSFPASSVNDKRARKDCKLLTEADALVLVLDMKRLRDEEICKKLQEAQISDDLKHVFVVVNVDRPLSPGEMDVPKEKLQRSLQRYFLNQNKMFDRVLFNERIFFINITAAFKARTDGMHNSERSPIPELEAVEAALARFLLTDDKIAQKFEPTLKVLRSCVGCILKQIASAKERLAQQRNTQASSYITALNSLEKQLTEQVKKANVTVYPSQALVQRHSPPSNTSPKQQPPPQGKVDSQLDPLKIWIDAEDHLQFAARVVQRPDVPETIREAIQQRSEQIRQRERDPDLYLAVVGEFSSGKSTFINALLRQELLPTSVLPTTAAETLFRYGTQLDLTVRFKTLAQSLQYSKQSAHIWQQIRLASPDVKIDGFDLSECLRLLTSVERVADRITSVIVHHSAAFLRNNVVIIDTPGVNALNEQHAHITYNLIEREADSAVIIIPAPIPLSITLVDFLKEQLKPYLHRCIFVVTQIDRVRERERDSVVENIRRRLTSTVALPQSTKVHACSAQLVLDSMAQPNAALNGANWNDQFRDLEGMLFERLRRERMLSIAESLLRLLQQLFEQLDDYLQQRWESYRRRKAAIESDVIQDLKSFTSEQHRTYRLELQATVMQTRTEGRRIVSGQSAKTRENIHKAIFEAKDENALKIVLTQQAHSILDSSGQVITQKLQETLRKLSLAAERIGRSFDEEFTKEYSRLRAVSGLLVAGNQGTNRDLLPDVSIVLSPAEELNRRMDQKGNWTIGGVALGGAAVGTAIMPGLGTVIGLLAGGIIGAMFGPSLEKRKAEVWQQLEPQLASCFAAMDEAVAAKIESHAQALQTALDKRIDTYIARYKSTVDTMIRQQQGEQAELQRLQTAVEQDRKELTKRRSNIERKRKELAASTL